MLQVLCVHDFACCVFHIPKILIILGDNVNYSTKTTPVYLLFFLLCVSDPESIDCPRRLHELRVPRLYRRHQRELGVQIECCLFIIFLVCFSDPESIDCPRRLHELWVPRLYRRHQRARRHPLPAGRRPRRRGNTRTCLWHDQQESIE